MVKVLFCQLWNFGQATPDERDALVEVVAAGGELTRWAGSVRLPCVVCGRGCRVGPRQQQVMVDHGVEVYCFFDAAAAAVGTAGAAGAPGTGAGGQGAVAAAGWVDLGNPQT